MVKLGRRIIATLHLPRSADAHKELIMLIHRFAGVIDQVELTSDNNDWDFDCVRVEIAMGCEVSA